MSLLDHVHGDYVHGRRTKVLSQALARLVPPGGCVLDVGCGDGLISSRIRKVRPDTRIEGIDVLVRPRSHVPVTKFDGVQIPFPDRSFDAVMFIDVLHHTDDPMVLLREAVRVSRNLVLLKDHTLEGVLARPTLRVTGWVGNARHGVAIPANYWHEEQWIAAFERLKLEVKYWTRNVRLYPAWASPVFGRSLHFVASLTKSSS